MDSWSGVVAKELREEIEDDLPLCELEGIETLGPQFGAFYKCSAKHRFPKEGVAGKMGKRRFPNECVAGKMGYGIFFTSM